MTSFGTFHPCGFQAAISQGPCHPKAGEEVMDRGVRVGVDSRVETALCSRGLSCSDERRLLCQTRPNGSWSHPGPPPTPTHMLQLFLALGCAEHATEK